MKKAKLTLLTILILSVTGAVFAFKSQRGINTLVYIETIISGNVLCTVPAIVIDRTTDPALGGVSNTIKASLNPTTATCPIITLYEML